MYDVALVGYGPTGATLANLLALQGLNVLVLEREAKIYHLPRAVHFDDEVMRVFQTVGIADDLLPLVHVNPGMKFVDQSGTALLDWPRPQEITEHGWNASYRLHQPDLERLLRDKLANYEKVTVASETMVTALSSTPDHVEIETQNRQDATRTQKYQARYVVGCDGANSIVRQSMGSTMKDFGFEERWLVVDVLLKHPRPDLGDHSIQFCDPERPMTYCRSPGIRRRWEITILPDETETEVLTESFVWDLLKRWITPKDAEIERTAVYTFHSQVAKTWRSERVMIAGDAAHLTPPFMGQGMCTGIRDAANLAWKLGHVIKEDAEDDILDSYGLERRPHAQSYVETAIKLGALINSLDRNTAKELSSGNGQGQMRSIAPRLGQSALTQASCAQHDASSLGRPAPQFTTQHNTERFDDRIGYAHSIISHQKPDGMRNTVLWLDAGRHSEANRFLKSQDAAAIWVRPDRYVGSILKDTDLIRKTLPTFLFDDTKNESHL